jgi:hypothetical protein
MPDTITIPETVSDHAKAIRDALERLRAADEEADKLAEAFLERIDLPHRFGAATFGQVQAIRDELSGQHDYDPGRFAREGRELVQLVEFATQDAGEDEDG